MPLSETEEWAFLVDLEVAKKCKENRVNLFGGGLTRTQYRDLCMVCEARTMVAEMAKNRDLSKFPPNTMGYEMHQENLLCQAFLQKLKIKEENQSE